MTSQFEKTVERALGESIDSIRRVTVAARRADREAKSGRRVKFVSYFPFIGCGNVLRDRIVTHEQAEALLKRALRGG